MAMPCLAGGDAGQLTPASGFERAGIRGALIRRHSSNAHHRPKQSAIARNHRPDRAEMANVTCGFLPASFSRTRISATLGEMAVKCHRRASARPSI